jgi:hypothetical protein
LNAGRRPRPKAGSAKRPDRRRENPPPAEVYTSRSGAPIRRLKHSTPGGNDTLAGVAGLLIGHPIAPTEFLKG